MKKNGIAPDSLAARLKSRLAWMPMSQKELAECIGVSENTIMNYVSERHSPDALTIAKICQTLQCSADWLLFGHEPEVTSTGMQARPSSDSREQHAKTILLQTAAHYAKAEQSEKEPLFQQYLRGGRDAYRHALSLFETL